MTASFLEQMLTIYTHLGMLSRGKEFPSPLVGRGRGRVQPSQDPPVLLCSDIPPHKGEGKKYPLVGSIQDAVGEAGSEAFAGMTMRGSGSD